LETWQFEELFTMKRYLGVSSLILGLALLVGCGQPPEQPPAPTEAEYEAQQKDYQKSMEAGKAAAGAAGSSAPNSNSGK